MESGDVFENEVNINPQVPFTQVVSATAVRAMGVNVELDHPARAAAAEAARVKGALDSSST